jgi:hypothetical protein
VLESWPQYIPTTCFETFPFPQSTDERREAIAAASVDLGRLRTGWLNPPNKIEAEFKPRALTNLYNQRPTWLVHAQAALDAVVIAAGWPEDVDDEDILARLLGLNLQCYSA